VPVCSTGNRILNDPHQQFQQLHDFYMFGDIRSPLIDEWDQDWGTDWTGPISHGDWTAIFRALFRLRSIARRPYVSMESQAAVLAGVATVEHDIDALVQSDAAPNELAFVKTEFWARSVQASTNQKADPESVGKAVQQADAAAASFSDCLHVQVSLASAHSHFAWMLCEQGVAPARVVEVAETIDAIAERFPQVSTIGEECAWAWRYAISEASHESADREQLTIVIEHLKDLADRFPADIGVYKALAVAWWTLLKRASGTPEGPPISDEIEEIGKRFEDVADIQWSRANACGTLARMSANDPKRRHEAEEMARRVDRYAAPFPDHLGLQCARVFTWAAVADAGVGPMTE
jgi:hypothetical protein